MEILFWVGAGCILGDIFRSMPKVEYYTNMWEISVPIKIMFFTWLATLFRKTLWLGKFWIKKVISNHILFDCEESWKVWNKVLDWWGLNAHLTNDVKRNFFQFWGLIDPRMLLFLRKLKRSVKRCWRKFRYCQGSGIG